MRLGEFFRREDKNQSWYRKILEEHYEEALSRADSLLDEAEITEDGCYLTATKEPQKVRFRGRQVHAYRFVFVVYQYRPLAGSQVLQHRCNNRRCINPDHLLVGDAAGNWNDEQRFRANGLGRFRLGEGG